MKSVLLAAYLAIVPTLLLAQSSEPSSSPKDDLYSLALQASIMEMEKQWGYIDDSFGGGRIRTDYHHVIVIKDPKIADKLPTQFKNRSVEYLDQQSLIERWKKVRKSFAVLEISPIRNDGDRLKIIVGVYWVSYEKDRLMLGWSDWSEVEFRHDCEQETFAITSIKLGGI
jgi:hypothetical protein